MMYFKDFLKLETQNWELKKEIGPVVAFGHFLPNSPEPRLRPASAKRKRIGPAESRMVSCITKKQEIQFEFRVPF
jgi:hypothetical protein